MKFEKFFPNTVRLLQNAIPAVFPACSVAVATPQGESVYSLGCDREAFFDLASLTKVLCTTTLFAIGETQGKIDIEQSMQRFFPRFKNESVLISHLLNHSAGFESWLPLHEEASISAMESKILDAWHPERFGKQVVYSDLGFILLGWILENHLEKRLDSLFQDWITRPLQLETLQFLPVHPDILPTENCPWRKRLLIGEVHDENAFALGGIAGHAGLFGPASSVLRIAQEWMKALQNKKSLIDPTVAMKYWTFSHVPDQPRVLGWDGVNLGASSAGKFFSSAARGHLGFTGTSLWIDPHQELIVCLLTNRVHPSRQNQKIKAFRPIFHDTLISEVLRNTE